LYYKDQRLPTLCEGLIDLKQNTRLIQLRIYTVKTFTGNVT